MKNSYAVCFSIAKEDGSTRTWMFNHPEFRSSASQNIREIKEILDSATRIVAHNIKFDLLWLMAYNIDISKYKVFCTQVAEYLLRGQRSDNLSLAELSKEYGISDKIDKVKVFWDSGYETDEIPSNILVPYCEQDCINTLALYQRQSEKIMEHNLSALCTVQFELCKILATIEFNGMLISKPLVVKYGEDYGRDIDDINRRLFELFRTEGGVDTSSFNIDSNEQLSAVLYGGLIRQEGREEVEKLRKDGSIRRYERKCIHDIRIKGLDFRPMPNTEFAKGGYYQTSIEVLKSLKCKTPQQKLVIELLIEKSRLSKLKSTYFDGILERMQADDTIHPSLNQTIARTGRLTSSNPNGQNFPRGSTGPVKKIFVTRY